MEKESGKSIAYKIRKMLLNCDLRLVYANGEKNIANEEYQCEIKLSGRRHTKRALKAKIRRDCYKIYIGNVQKIKQDILDGLNACLSKYSVKYKRIWLMYFLEQKSIDEISDEVGYSRDNVNKIIARLKDELAKDYKWENKLYDKRR